MTTPKQAKEIWHDAVELKVNWVSALNELKELVEMSIGTKDFVVLSHRINKHTSSIVYSEAAFNNPKTD